MDRDPPFAVRRLTGAEAAAWRVLRREALHLHPEAFGAAPEDEAARTEAEIAAMLDRPPPDAVLGAFEGTAGVLLGSIGLAAMRGAKQQHKALLWGLHVRPEARGRGIGAALVRAVLDQARQAGLEQVQLGVGSENASALALYRAAGFVPFGLERAALRLGPGRYVDELLMAVDLRG